MSALAWIFQILNLGLGIAQRYTTGGAAETVTIAKAIEEIAQAAANAYQAHTGEALDWSKIQKIDPIP